MHSNTEDRTGVGKTSPTFLTLPRSVLLNSKVHWLYTSLFNRSTVNTSKNNVILLTKYYPILAVNNPSILDNSNVPTEQCPIRHFSVPTVPLSLSVSTSTTAQQQVCAITVQGLKTLHYTASCAPVDYDKLKAFWYYTPQDQLFDTFIIKILRKINWKLLHLPLRPWRFSLSSLKTL